MWDPSCNLYKVIKKLSILEKDIFRTRKYTPYQEVMHLNLKIEPIGIIKNTVKGISDVLIYSEFEEVLGNAVGKFEKGAKLLIIHKKNDSSDRHQVQVTSTELINRKGNLLTVRGIEPDNDSVIDVRLNI